MRLLLSLSLSLLAAAAPASASDWPDATPTAWHQLARAESLLSAPEPPNPVAVCIVDSGVNLTPDLALVVIERLAYDGGDPGDTYPQEGIDDGHGTYVATFLAGQVNGWGGAGLWPRAKIVSVRVFPPGGKRASVYDYVDGLRMCRQEPLVRVINLSLGDVDGSDQELRELENKILQLRREEGINVVAAAGNRGGAVEVPARFPPSFAVGAATAGGQLCSISARGPELDVIAPGCELSGSDLAGNQASFSGTSFAAPMVSALLAGIRGYTGASAEQAEAFVLSTSRDSDGHRLIDAGAALHAAGFRPAPPAPTAQTREPAVHLELPLLLPRARATWNGSRLVLKLLNRPTNASAEVVVHGRLRVAHSTVVRIRVRRRPRSIRLRYLDDEGTSEWRKFRPIDRRPGTDARRGSQSRG